MEKSESSSLIDQHVMAELAHFTVSQSNFLKGILLKRFGDANTEGAYRRISEQLLRPLNQELLEAFGEYGRRLELKLMPAVRLEVESLISEQAKEDGLLGRAEATMCDAEHLDTDKVTKMQKLLDGIDDESSISEERKRFNFAVLKRILRRTEELLAFEPTGIFLKDINLWKRLKPLTFDQFEHYIAKASPETPQLDLSDTEFKTWREGKITYRGTRLRNTEKSLSQAAKPVRSERKHGVVRVIKRNEFIAEATYKDGKFHGLYRFISDSMVKVSLYREDIELAHVQFNSNLRETSRQDL